MTPDEMAALNKRNMGDPGFWANQGGIYGPAWMNAQAGHGAFPTTTAEVQADAARSAQRADAGKTTQLEPLSPVGPSAPAAPASAGGNYGWPVPNSQPAAAPAPAAPVTSAQPAGNAAPAPLFHPQQQGPNPVLGAMGGGQHGSAVPELRDYGWGVAPPQPNTVYPPGTTPAQAHAIDQQNSINQYLGNWAQYAPGQTPPNPLAIAMQHAQDSNVRLPAIPNAPAELQPGFFNASNGGFRV